MDTLCEICNRQLWFANPKWLKHSLSIVLDEIVKQEWVSEVNGKSLAQIIENQYRRMLRRLFEHTEF